MELYAKNDLTKHFAERLGTNQDVLRIRLRRIDKTVSVKLCAYFYRAFFIKFHDQETLIPKSDDRVEVDMNC